MSNLYNFSATSLNGRPLAFEAYRGKVALVVNTASRCRFTPQYDGLQTLHKRFQSRGFEVLAFPCNQFGKQEQGSSADIAGFCQRHYGVSFQMFEKVEVNGNGAHPLYRWLTSVAPGLFGTRAIKWNFTKFLLGRNGTVFKRYGSWTPPQHLAADIDRLLG